MKVAAPARLKPSRYDLTSTATFKRCVRKSSTDADRLHIWSREFLVNQDAHL